MVFRDAGFSHLHVVPYPHEAGTEPAREPAEFRTLLFAGAARRDKGFHIVVDLVQRLKERGSERPVTIQCSATHWGEHDAAVAEDLQRLRSIAYPHLRLIEETLAAEAYRELFRCAITIQPYDAGDFADRVSGVTLDALAAGSPLIVPAHTWMARQVEREGAGVIVDNAQSVDELHAAVERIVGNWDDFAANAARAAQRIAGEHDARKLLEILTR
jgi:glycosyltransferase involved in cell wall biosynthesis